MIVKIELCKNDGTSLFKLVLDGLQAKKWMSGPGEPLSIEEPNGFVNFYGFVYEPVFIHASQPIFEKD